MHKPPHPVERPALGTRRALVYCLLPLMLGMGAAYWITFQWLVLGLMNANMPSAALPPATHWLEMLALCIFVAILSLVTSRWIQRMVVQPLQQLSRHAQAMAQQPEPWEPMHSPVREIVELQNSFLSLSRQLQEREHQIRQTAYQDPLTGLANRTYLLLALRDRIQRAREPVTIVTWSIDNFDGIQEVLGHDLAQHLLKKAARKARHLCADHIVLARLEGPLFGALVPSSLYALKPSLERILQSTVRVRQHALSVEARAGVAHYPAHGHYAEDLLRDADMARQVAVKTRRRVIEFDQRMAARSAARIALIGELKAAIADEQFCLHFQPKLNLRTNNINQAEVLIRWNHPERGLIAPGGFIELAEQTGLIRDITRWVLLQVYGLTPLCLRQNLKLSMNLSAIDLEDPDLLQFCKNLHRGRPEGTRHITLEITESAAMKNPDQALELLTGLAELGFQIAIDDYGTGYSSLAYLRRFPVTELKIDRSLVQGADLDADSQIILESTIQMGHTMGLVVTTEGVEHDAEFEVVRKLGVDYVQGFWLSRPMPYEEFRLKHLVGNHDQLTQPN
ncbi:EAL domain-containing protein [Limnobacter humi]|uniref:EAL domain-containing protein n=1 Tax=Limnobacter humi TaxID=1778671 RepID=A0ABT1WC76_9BURK|nr:EAL domain-containing protein [Limnobacter humi]MCQ8895107.1 EAL domain-containing protein [Limnobacter humi]